ncbi:MAG: hypothetical protein JNM75_08735 [Rhodospirillales bacterium]|nr:hypothetical protein [Rhodospirillales bacterium]
MTYAWPDISFAQWRESCEALHLFAQIVGKYRLARAPWMNHSWHATLYVNARGLTTSLVPDRPGGIEIVLDLLDHAVVGAATDGRSARFSLQPMSVADFHARFLALLSELGGTAELHGRPNEVADPVAFRDDRDERPYDRERVTRFFQAAVLADRIFKRFRTAYIGKASPVHLFWGSFDLAVTRFSGRTAPLHPGGVPALPDDVTREAYSHEVSSAGFWPGGGVIDEAAFYSYAYPAPAGFGEARVAPDAAFYDAGAGEFLLPYDAVRRADDPEATLMSFLQSTYEAAATLGGWDRPRLECPMGQPRRPRPLFGLGTEEGS